MGRPGDAVLRQIRQRFAAERPLRGVKIAACLHVTSETANLALTLSAGGAEVHLCASNPLSTQDDVAASLVSDHGISVYAIRGEDRDTYYAHIDSSLDVRPHITMDDGADTVTRALTERTDVIDGIIGGCEETTDRGDKAHQPCGGGPAQVPDHRRQRCRHQALFR